MGKLTLSVDSTAILLAKKYALSKGVSLSELVENYFRLLVKNKSKTSIDDDFFETRGMWKDIKETNKDIRSRSWRK
ncbi:MAG: hypothetical protein JNL63_04510 [Bacteroidia bacterium]|nr:hypothetical protein [Bacteroidia bacterium]